MTACLGIADLKPDMTLAGDLRAFNGRLLMPQGLRLSAEHIRIMRMWGVVEAPVEQDGAVRPSRRDMGKASGIGRDPETARIGSRFCRTDVDHPAMSVLYRCALDRSGSACGETSPRPAKTRDRTRNERAAVAAGGTAKPIFSDEFWERVKLPTLPAVFAKIREAVMNPRSSAHDIACVIGKDTGLTARLLKIANSAFYGFSRPVDSIQRAVMIIGAKQLTMLSDAVNIIDSFKKIDIERINMASFWRHSVACGLCARTLAGYRNMRDTERFFVAGLLHDIGRLLLYQYAPEDMEPLLCRARSEDALLHELESEALQIDHAALGGRLIKKWNLPPMLEDTVRFHHAPGKSAGGIEATVLHVADITANAVGMGSSGPPVVPPLDPGAWERLGLPANTLSETVQQMDLQMNDIMSIFFPNGKAIASSH